MALTAFGWAVSHLERGAFNLGGNFVLGLILGYVRLRTGSTLLTIAMHAVNNLVEVLVGFLFLYIFH